MHKLITICLCISFLVSCNSKKKEAELLELTKPEWLKNRPVSNSYFYGIGTTPKQGGVVYYKERSKEKALADLSKQINTQIKSEQSLYRMEDNSGVYEYMQSRLRATSNEFLEGYEYVDDWEDLNYYYTFYRLSKSEFYAIKAQRKEEALKLSLSKYQQAQKAQQLNDLLLALEQYAAAIDAISGYLNEQTSIDTPEGSIDLYEVSKDAIADIIASLKLSFQPEKIEAKANTKLNEGHSMLLVKSGSEIVQGIPVRFNYSGGFLSTDKFKSDLKGQVKCPELNITNKQETLKASIDLKTLSRNLTKNLIVRQIIGKQKPATASLMIEVIK